MRKHIEAKNVCLKKIKLNDELTVKLTEFVSAAYKEWFKPQASWTNDVLFNHILPDRDYVPALPSIGVVTGIKQGVLQTSDSVVSADTMYKLVKRNQVVFNAEAATKGVMGMLVDVDLALIYTKYGVFGLRDTLNPTYFRYLIASDRFKHLLRNSTSVGGRVTFDTFKRVQVVLPPVEQQEAFECFVAPFELELAYLKAETEQLNKVVAELTGVIEAHEAKKEATNTAESRSTALLEQGMKLSVSLDKSGAYCVQYAGLCPHFETSHIQGVGSTFEAACANYAVKLHGKVLVAH